MICCSVAQSCPSLCNPMGCSMPGFHVLYHLPKLAQTNIYQVGDTIQPSHPQSSPSCLQSFPESGSFQWVNSLHEVAKVLELQLLPMNTQDWFPLGWTGLISLQPKGLSRVFNTTIWKHQLFGTQPFLWSNSHTHTWILEWSHPYMTT